MNSSSFYAHMLAFSLLGLCDVSWAERPALSGACLVGQADMILLGKVSEITDEPYLRDEFSDIHIASIRVEQVFRGRAEIGGNRSETIWVTTRKGLSDQANLDVGRQYILFIKNSESGPYVLNGGQGAKPVIHGAVGLEDISGKRAVVSLNNIRTEIQRMEKIGCLDRSTLSPAL